MEYRQLAAGFAIYNGFDGYVITKAVYQKHIPPKDCTCACHTEVNILPGHSPFTVLEAVSQEPSVTESLTIYLLKPYKTESAAWDAASSAPLHSGKDTHPAAFCFTGDEILSFVQQVRDTNPLHRTTRPIVPGLLILEYLLETLRPATDASFQLSVRFRKPLYAGCRFVLMSDMQKHTFYGQICDNDETHCFDGTFCSSPL